MVVILKVTMYSVVPLVDLHWTSDALHYEQHEHPFTLYYTTEDDCGEYYCDISEEERNPKHWFYYCTDCSFPAHPKCIIGQYPNVKKQNNGHLFKVAYI